VNAGLLKTHLPNHPTQLYLIRHGEVEETYHKVFGGSRIDMGLSPHGLRQAEALDSWLADTKLDAVYASPMKRVQQTMAPLLARRSVTPTIMQDLREIDFGDWTGHTWGGIHENFGINVFDWLEVLEDPGAPNGESAQQLADRVRPCLTQVLHDNPHRTAAIVCHGGIIRVILSAAARTAARQDGALQHRVCQCDRDRSQPREKTRRRAGVAELSGAAIIQAMKLM